MTESRSKVLRKNITLSYAVKGSAIIVGVLTIRAYMSYFDDYEVLGIWYTLLAVLSWILNFDLGIGNGLRNLLASALVDGDEKRIRSLISTGYAVLGLVCFGLAIICGFLVIWMDWNAFFNVSISEVSRFTLKASVCISAMGIIVQLYLKIICSVLNAMEKTALTGFLALITNVGMLVFVCLPTTMDEQMRLITLSIAYFIAATLPYLLATLVTFIGPMKKCRPTPSMIESSLVWGIVALGWRFLIVQVLLMTITVTNEVYITWLFSSSDVVVFQAYNKVFSTILTLFAIVCSPIWSSVAKAWYAKDFEWVDEVKKKLFRLSLVVIAISLLVSLVLQQVFDIWLGYNIVVVSIRDVVPFILLAVVMSLAYSQAAIANGMSELKTQTVCYLFAAIFKYPLCLIIAGLIQSWSAVVFANAVVMLPYVVVQHVTLNGKIKKVAHESED